MKRKIIIWSIFFSIIMTIVLSIFFFYKKREIDKNLSLEKSNNVVTEKVNIEKDIISTNVNEEKITPKTKLEIKKQYTQCGHIASENVELPTELINLTKEELANKYKNFTIETFSSQKVMLYKQEEGICNEHYVLREKDGFIAIYNTLNLGEENLRKITEISTEYLAESDLINLKNGIAIYGEKNLNAVLEDFE